MGYEADLEGNYVGSSYGWASTRDWARFGQLYLSRGHWNGEQLFSPEWVDYITTPTQHSNGRYGAHFWLNAGGIYPEKTVHMQFGAPIEIKGRGQEEHEQTIRFIGESYKKWEHE